MAHQLRLSPWAGSSSARMHHVPMINRPCKSFALRASAASTQGAYTSLHIAQTEPAFIVSTDLCSFRFLVLLFAGSSSPATRAAPPPMLHLHVSSDTTVSIPFSANGGKALQSSLNGLIQTFVDKQKATRPQRWPLLEFRCKVGACIACMRCAMHADGTCRCACAAW